MRQSVTMKEVAKAAGVSVMTVSRAFKPNSAIGRDTRQTILKVAEELGYCFDATAANLRSQKTDFVAVIIPSLNNANFADTVSGLSDAIAGLGLQPLLGYTHYDIEREEHLIAELLRRRPEAIVLSGGNHTPRARRLLSAARIPVIETWDLPADPIGHVVGFSNAACIEMLVAHLTGTGRERITFIGGDSDGDTRGAARRRGFIDAMVKRGLDASRLVGAGKPPISMREGADAMARLLADHPETEAVIAVSDLSAFGVLTECQRRGIAVPDAIAIAGFGAYEIADVCVPSLTTIDPHPRAIGAQVGRLLERILGQDEAFAETISIEPELRIGETTARRSAPAAEPKVRVIG